MARVGGRSTWFAWVVGLIALAAVGALGWLALPLVAPSLSWVGSAVGGQSAASGSATPATAGPIDSCRALYSEALWSYLTQTSGGNPQQDTSPPVTTATEFTAALQPQVRFTCSWKSDAGTVTTTIASVGPDAGAIAIAALPGLGFTCESPDGATGRVRCFLDAENGGEEIDLLNGVWVSSRLDGWQPERYASRVAQQVLAATG